jgi:hypothetical protein
MRSQKDEEPLSGSAADSPERREDSGPPSQHTAAAAESDEFALERPEYRAHDPFAEQLWEIDRQLDRLGGDPSGRGTPMALESNDLIVAIEEPLTNLLKAIADAEEVAAQRLPHGAERLLQTLAELHEAILRARERAAYACGQGPFGPALGAAKRTMRTDIRAIWHRYHEALAAFACEIETHHILRQGDTGVTGASAPTLHPGSTGPPKPPRNEGGERTNGLPPYVEINLAERTLTVGEHVVSPSNTVWNFLKALADTRQHNMSYLKPSDFKNAVDTLRKKVGKEYLPFIFERTPRGYKLAPNVTLKDGSQMNIRPTKQRR